MSNGKVPQRLNAAMNMRMALDGVVPTSWVAAAKAAFSSGKTFATTGVMCSAMALPFWNDGGVDRCGPRGWATGCEGNPIGPHLEFVLRRWYYLVFLSITPQIEYHTRPYGDGEKRIILLLGKYLERDDVRDIEGPSVSGIVRGKQQHTAVEQVEHGLGACVARSGI